MDFAVYITRDVVDGNGNVTFNNDLFCIAKGATSIKNAVDLWKVYIENQLGHSIEVVNGNHYDRRRNLEAYYYSEVISTTEVTDIKSYRIAIVSLPVVG